MSAVSLLCLLVHVKDPNSVYGHTNKTQNGIFTTYVDKVPQNSAARSFSKSGTGPCSPWDGGQKKGGRCIRREEMSARGEGWDMGPPKSLHGFGIRCLTRTD